MLGRYCVRIGGRAKFNVNMWRGRQERLKVHLRDILGEEWSRQVHLVLADDGSGKVGCRVLGARGRRESGGSAGLTSAWKYDPWRPATGNLLHA